MRRRRLLILLVAAVVALTACDIDATVTVSMRDDGSGRVALRVRLDRDAVARAGETGGSLDDLVRLDDLPDAGWRVGRWRRGPRGAASITISKPFARPAQISAIVAEIAGPRGPLRAFAGRRRTSTFSTDWALRGTVDLREMTAGITDDAELFANLTARRVDPDAVELRLAEELRGLTVRARLVLPDGSVETGRATVGERTTVTAAADDTDAGRILLVVVGVATVVAALVVFVVGERSTRRRRAARPANIPRRST